MLSGKESIETLQTMIKEAIEQDDWFLVGRLQARLDKAKNLKK
jgi:hypothetical protein